MPAKEETTKETISKVKLSLKLLIIEMGVLYASYYGINDSEIVTRLNNKVRVFRRMEAYLQELENELKKQKCKPME
jgi:hypothetical protein